MHRQTSPRPNPAETITRAIIERLEAGVRPWVQPWTGASISRPLRACGTPYQGINVVWLWMTAQMGGFASPYWMTYLQAQKLGGQVRRGERSTIAVFYKSYSAEVEDRATGETQQEARRVLKSFPVFNASQVDGLPERFSPAPPAPVLDLLHLDLPDEPEPEVQVEAPAANEEPAQPEAPALVAPEVPAADVPDLALEIGADAESVIEPLAVAAPVLGVFLMLRRLSLKDFVIVPALELDFAAGFSALTVSDRGVRWGLLWDRFGAP